MQHILTLISKVFYCAFFFFFDIPSVDVALDTLDLVTDGIIAARYFLPLDTICQLTAATLGLLALRVLVTLLSSRVGKMFLEFIVGQFTGYGNMIMAAIHAIFGGGEK